MKVDLNKLVEELFRHAEVNAHSAARIPDGSFDSLKISMEVASRVLGSLSIAVQSSIIKDDDGT